MDPSKMLKTSVKKHMDFYINNKDPDAGFEF